MNYKIDASNRILGRLAGEVAILLRGKNEPSFLPHVNTGNVVEVINSEKLVVTGKKDEGKKYWRYTGYPGGIKMRTYRELMKRDSKTVLYKAVYGMLPKNRLRAKMMKRLIIK